jgi:hypothetical protein
VHLSPSVSHRNGDDFFLRIVPDFASIVRNSCSPLALPH